MHNMKKIYFSLITLLAAGALSATAQQLPNNGFEDTWTDCVPWTSKNNTAKQGTTPSPWIVSNTVGTGTIGKTTVATNVTGHNGSNNAVELTAKSVAGKNIPGYMSLGTAWSTAKGMTGSNPDGGTFGGYAFTYRPDAVSFYYKRAENTTEKSTVVIYAWKGSWSQANVPGNISLSSCTTVTMTDRERNILGMTTSQGGTVTPSADAELIASTTHYISDTQTDWANLEIPIEYKSTSTPTKFNVIFAAGEYFESAPKTNGKSFTIDDVKLLYYSRLASLSVNGTSVAGFNSNTYNYTVDSEMPEESAFAFTCLGNSGSGKATLSLDKENAKATITVTNSNAGGTDVDGQTSHVYTINFTGKAVEEPTVVSTRVFTGVINVTMATEPMDPLEDADVKLLEMSDGTYSLLLEKFGADAENPEGLGDINFNNLTLDGTRIYGTKNDISLAGGEIKAGGSLEGTLDGNSLVADLDLDWLDDQGNSQAKIIVNFTGTEGTSGITDVPVDNSNAPVEYFNIQGMRINADNLTPGIYIRRQGTDVRKVLVK